MAGDGDNSGSAGSEGEGQQTGSQESQQGNESAGNEGGWKAPADEKEFNRIIQARVRREQEKYADYSDLKNKASEFDKLQEANKSDLEKAQTAAQQAEARAQQAEERATSLTIRNALIAEAVRQKAIDPDAVVALVDKSTLKVGDDGKVTGVEDTVTALLEDKKYLIQGTTFTGSADGGSRGGGGQVTYTREQLRDHKFYQEHQADILLAQREGRITQ